MAIRLLSRAELCTRVGDILREPFRWWHLKFLMESGVLRDDFTRVGGKRVFHPSDVERVARAVRKTRVGRSVSRSVTGVSTKN